MAKWLSVNTHLKENPYFRIVVDITIGGSDQHLGIVSTKYGNIAITYFGNTRFKKFAKVCR